MARCACSAACGDSISCFPAVSTRESNKGTTPRPCRWNIIAGHLAGAWPRPQCRIYSIGLLYTYSAGHLVRYPKFRSLDE
jgi:hypothetical protein